MGLVCMFYHQANFMTLSELLKRFVIYERVHILECSFFFD